MAGTEKAPAIRKRARWKLLTVAVLIQFTVPGVRLAVTEANKPLLLLQRAFVAAAFLYLLFRILRVLIWGVKATAGRVKYRPKEDTSGAPVSWLLSAPSSSPTRISAERNLPEYCARLITERSVSQKEGFAG
jgi:hypothetical protein